MNGYHYHKFSNALSNRAVYAGIYTSDLVIISLFAFATSSLLKDQSIEVVYLAIAGMCIPTYIFLIIKNKYYCKSSAIFWMRKTFLNINKNINAKDIYETTNW